MHVKGNPVAQRTLDSIEQLISAEGDTAATQEKIGKKLLALVEDPEFRYDNAELVTDNDIENGVSFWQLATHASGSRILAWENVPYDWSGKPPFIHYHGQWEVLTVLPGGNWIDSFYMPIPANEDPFKPGKKTLRFKGNEEIQNGEYMVIEPHTPHGFQTGDFRDVSGILISYIGAYRAGRRMDIDPETGEATVGHQF